VATIAEERAKTRDLINRYREPWRTALLASQDRHEAAADSGDSEGVEAEGREADRIAESHRRTWPHFARGDATNFDPCA